MYILLSLSSLTRSVKLARDGNLLIGNIPEDRKGSQA